MNELADIYMQGYLSYHSGEPLGDNPYISSWSSEALVAWQEGWYDAQENCDK